MNKVVKCNMCECLFRAVEPEMIADGDLQYYYFECPECHTKYLMSITDSALREGIAEILRLNTLLRKNFGANKKTEDLKRRMAKLSEKNKSANHKLRDMYRAHFSELVEGAYVDNA